jgi:hypothetical protein
MNRTCLAKIKDLHEQNQHASSIRPVKNNFEHMKRSLYFLIVLLLSLFSEVQSQDPVTMPLRFDHYYTYDQLVAALKLLNKTYPELTNLEIVGKSEEGRDIYLITINNKGTGAPSEKPGVYVDGNIHGNEIQASEVCLYLANQLLENYGKNDKITGAVNKNAWYILPCVNVDGRAHFFSDPNDPSSGRSIRIPVDDDRDGLVDEDYPDDLDGDGNITMMRKKDPFGKYKSDPEDPRLMIPVKAGEMGEWTLLGEEGIDNDDDGRINEDSEGYVDGNRNWGYSWNPPYVQSGSGLYPFSGTGIRAIGTWLINHPNIIMVYAFHNSGGMFLRGPSIKVAGELPVQDISVYDYLGKNNEQIVPGYRYLISWKDLYPTYGDFTDFTNNLIGTYSFVGELTPANTETYSGKPINTPNTSSSDIFVPDNQQERERLKFNDNVVQGVLYMPWKKFNHPAYGEIEIGGWVKMSTRLPHPFMLQDMVHRVSAAVIFSAGQTPEVKLEVTDKKSLGKNLFQITVRLSNNKAMPSMTYLSAKNNLYPKDILRISGEGAKIISGGLLINQYTNQVTFKEYKPEIQFCQVPGLGKVEYRFLVSGKGKISIEYESRKAGKKSTSIDL